MQSLLIRCELQSRDQSRKGPREQTAAAAPHQAPSTTAHQLGLGPSARYRGPKLSPDQLGQPRWRGWGVQGKMNERQGNYILTFWECILGMLTQFVQSTVNKSFLTVYTSSIWPSKDLLMHTQCIMYANRKYMLLHIFMIYFWELRMHTCSNLFTFIFYVSLLYAISICCCNSAVTQRSLSYTLSYTHVQRGIIIKTVVSIVKPLMEEIQCQRRFEAKEGFYSVPSNSDLNKVIL